MTCYIVDWRQPSEYMSIHEGTVSLKLKPLYICTKDKCCLELEGRLIMQINDDSIIVREFGTFPNFVENVLNALIEKFFSLKDRQEFFSNRVMYLEELENQLKEELMKYNIKVQKFMVVSIETPRYSSTNKVPDVVPETKEQEQEKEKEKQTPDMSSMYYMVLHRMILLLVLMAVAFALVISSVYSSNKTNAMLGALLAIVIIICSIYQTVQIRKMMRTIKMKNELKDILIDLD